MKFRKKPVEIEAFRWAENTEQCWQDFLRWHAEVKPRAQHLVGRTRSAFWGVFIETLEGQMNVSVGDWIVCGVEGELYPCKPDIFAKTYEAV